jgi:hypothetical protein
MGSQEETRGDRPEGDEWSDTLELRSRPFGNATTPAQLAIGRPPPRSTPGVFKLIAGSLGVLVVVAFITWWVHASTARARAAHAAAAAASAAIAAETEAEAEHQAEAEAELRRQVAVQAADDERRRRIAERERLDVEARQAAVDDTEARARAWAAFYRPSPACRDASTTECVNAYIRAKRAFEMRYAAAAVSAAASLPPSAAQAP